MFGAKPDWQNALKKGATVFVESLNIMNPALLQMFLGIVAFFTLVMAARSGLTPVEKKATDKSGRPSAELTRRNAPLGTRLV
jgi:hypothetical protein